MSVPEGELAYRLRKKPLGLLSRALSFAEVNAQEERAWLTARKMCLGASDAAAALGLSPYKSPFALWVEKTSDAFEVEENERMKWGKLLEPVIADAYAEEYGRCLFDLGRMSLLRQITDVPPWMGATLDRVDVSASAETDLSIADILDPLVTEVPSRLTRPLFDPAHTIVEIKTVDSLTWRKWGETCPESWELQAHHQMAVTGLERVDFAVLVGGNRFVTFPVERSESLIENLVEAESGFWRYVEEKKPPPSDGSTATQDALRSLFKVATKGKSVEITRDLHERYSHAKAMLAVAEKAEKEAKAEVMAAMEDAESAEIDGEVAFTWKSSDVTRISTKRLKEEEPEIAARFSETSPERRFFLKRLKESDDESE